MTEDNLLVYVTVSWEWGRTQPGDSSFCRALTEVPDGLTWRGQGLHLADGWRLGSAGTVHPRAHEGPPQRGFRVVSLLDVQLGFPEQVFSGTKQRLCVVL